MNYHYNKVKLVSYTKPTPSMFMETNMESVEDLIAYCARVSNPNNQNNSKTSKKLIEYLIKHKHWSPLQMVDVTLEIETTRDIGRQILRHRSFEFQEFSQRYADPTQMEYVVREARLQDKKNRQNSIPVQDSELERQWSELQTQVAKLSREAYMWAIENGVAKEQARAVLPEGMTMSRMYMKGSLRSWVHYIDLRTTPGTQKEHMDVTHKCAKEIAKIFPMISEWCHTSE